MRPYRSRPAVKMGQTKPGPTTDHRPRKTATVTAARRGQMDTTSGLTTSGLDTAEEAEVRRSGTAAAGTPETAPDGTRMQTLMPGWQAGLVALWVRRLPLSKLMRRSSCRRPTSCWQTRLLTASACHPVTGRSCRKRHQSAGLCEACSPPGACAALPVLSQNVRKGMNALPRILGERGQRGASLQAQAQNGSGKTACFCIAVLLHALDIKVLHYLPDQKIGETKCGLPEPYRVRASPEGAPRVPWNGARTIPQFSSCADQDGWPLWKTAGHVQEEACLR